MESRVDAFVSWREKAVVGEQRESVQRVYGTKSKRFIYSSENEGMVTQDENETQSFETTSRSKGKKGSASYTTQKTCL